MNLQWLAIFLTIFKVVSLSFIPQSKISLVNYQYQRVSVDFSADVSEEYGVQVIKALEEIFRKASNVLELATRKITSFGKITILVPSTWKNKSGLIETSALKTEFHPSPFRIDNPHPVFGDEPYSLQPQQCGEQGLYVHLTPDFLVRRNFNGGSSGEAARKLVHNWIRYRYGVFPETGDPHHQQQQFPTFYDTEDGLRPTGCSNKKLDVDWNGVCILGSTDCRFNLSDRQDKDLSTSLMSWPDLKQVNSFCDKSNHNSLAPTIHNAMCQSRSVWDVLYEHEDFRTNKPPTGASPLSIPEFRVIQSMDPNNCVILIDTSSDQKNKVKLTTILAALERFIMINLPDNANVGVIHYSDQLYSKNMTALNLTSRTNIQRTFLYYREPRNKAILTRALEKAFWVLTGTGGIIVVISSGRADSELTEDRVAKLEETLQNHPITLTSIILGEPREDRQIPNSATTKVLQSLTKLSGGEFLAIHEKQSALDILTQVDRVLIQTAKLTDSKLLQVVYEVMPNGILSEGFYIDEDSSTDMLFSVTLENELWPVYLTSPTGQQFHSQDNSYSDSKSLKLVSFAIPSAQIGKWTYRIQPGNPNINSAITVTSRTNKTKPIDLEGWISVKKSNVSTWPVIIYGKLMRGSNPVTNALVKAVVVGNTEHTVVLSDAGNGDPDVFKNDGVYSRYIPGHLKMGYYTVWLTASDNGTSKTRLKSDIGSEIMKIQTGPFLRTASLGSFYVGHSGDICPPSRIADLLFISSSNNKVRLGWTEPGNDFDSGKAARYRFWWSKNVSCLTHIESACKTELFAEIPVWPKGSGHYQTADVLLPSMPSRVMYLAISAEDTARNPSPISNTIGIFWKQVHPSLDDPKHSAIVDSLPRAFGVTGVRCTVQCLPGSTVVVIIVGAIVICLVLVAIIITLCFMEQIRSRRNQNPILRPRLDIRPEVGSGSASPEMVASTASNGESENHQAIILDQEPPDVSNEAPEKGSKEPGKLMSDDALTYRPLLDERKPLTVLHSPNCLLNPHVIQCACCHSARINSLADLYV